MAMAMLVAFCMAWLLVLHPTVCNGTLCSPPCDPDATCDDESHPTDPGSCTCNSGFWGPGTSCTACACVTGATCNTTTGCTCSLPGLVCDKNDLTVTLTASPINTIIDTAGTVQPVTLTCTINIPDADVQQVVIIKVSGTNPPAPSQGPNGVYTSVLTDVHSGDSGAYRCDVTTTINGTSTVTMSTDYTLDVDCDSDYHGASCNMRCNCVTGGTCNQETGACSCTPAFAGATCDKDELTVTLTASPMNTIIDTAGTVQPVTLTCTINIPAPDAQVVIIKVSGTNPPAPSQGSNGVYTSVLTDVHPGDSGAYRCDVTTMINGASTVTMSNEHTLDVDCASDYHGTTCNQRCNCVTGGTCNQETGGCSCNEAFAGATCDKDALTVALTSNIPSPVTDFSSTQQSVTLTCNVNLPDADVDVKIVKLPSDQPISLGTATNGLYTVVLPDVHPATSGNYRCEATRNIDGAPASKTDDYLLTVNCASDYHGTTCNQRCNCVTGGTCDQETGFCNCTPAFTDAVCDKDSLRVLSVASNPSSPVPDTSSADDVTVKCRTNLPDSDARVALIYPETTTPIAMTHRMNGLYELTLPDVHESSSGDYTCTVSATPIGVGMTESGVLALSVVDVDECTSTQYPHDCNGNATCNNTKGGYLCPCNAGYEGTGFGSTGCTICTAGEKYGLNCEEDCTCVALIPGQIDVTCNNVDGTCTCNQAEFSGKKCDKKQLELTLLPDPNPVLDGAGKDDVIWNCTINLHSRDLETPVTLIHPNGSTEEMTMIEEGVYQATMFDVTPNLNGRYTCMTTANGMQMSKTGVFNLEVLIEGQIIGVSDPAEGVVGATVQIYCNVYARPDVDITWNFRSAAITNDTKYTVTKSSIGDFEQISYLTVSSLIPGDNGTYVCSASNDTMGALIIVIEEPVIANIQVSALAFDQLSVSWIIDFDGNLPPPSCTVEYSTSNAVYLPSPGSPVVDVTHVVTGLQPYTEYYVQVRCTNKVGPSNTIQGGPVRTLATNPSRPRNLAYISVQPESFVVTWDEPAKKNGLIDLYRVNVTIAPDGQVPLIGPVQGRRALVEGLTAFTNYTVEVTAFNTEGGQQLPSPPAQEIFTTAQDAPTPPVNVQTVDRGDTCEISWDRPENENGIIQSYTVHYSAYPRPVGNNTPIDQDSSGMDDINNGAQMTFTFIKSEHANYSEYQFRISATTVSTGNPSAVGNGSCITPPAAPAEGSVEQPVPGEPVSPDEEAITSTTFYMAVAPADERNGPISCYDIIVKELLENEDISSLDPDRDFPQEEVGDYGDSRDTPGRAYVAFVKQGSLLTKTENIKIGADRVTRCGVIGSRRRKRQAVYDHTGDNGILKYETKYTAFVRAFVKVGDGMEEVYTSSPFMQPVTTYAGPSVVGIVIGVILAVLIVVVLVLGALIYMKRRKQIPLLHEGENGVAMVPVTEKEPEVTHMVVLPITLENLSETVRQKSENDDEIFKAEFKSIPEATGDVTRDATNLECNREKNRYINIGAYDHTRVRLSPIEGEEGSDYINACFVDGYEKPRKFIAAQGAREDTVLDFWRMVWEQNCATIIMLTKCLENGREKCAEYWPEEDAIMYDDIIVTLDDVVTCADYVIRKFTLQKHIETDEDEDEDAEPIIGESRTLMQFHFLGWPDFGIPKYPHSMLCFVKRIRHMTGSRIEPGNIVVHCSAGVGRTGTYILIDSMLDMMKKEKKVDIYNVIYKLRNQRNLLVQSLVQYIFIHKALMEEFLYGHTEVDVGSFHIYNQKLCSKKSDADDAGVDTEYRTVASLPVDNTDQKTGNIEANKHKNRIRQVIPYDRNRVKLERLTGQEHSNYINASFIDGYEHKKAYIAAQGPLQNTMGDFWRMAWENQCSTIVMLTDCEERGQNVCTKYWPESGETLNPAFLVVSVKDCKEEEDCTIRDLEVSTTKGAGTKLIRQYHYHGWPEVGVPDNSASLVKVIGLAHEYQQDIGRFPILVHCSAGSGRTGVFITLSYLLQRAKAEGIVDVFQAVRTLRQQRPHMVQDVAQYQFCYRAMMEYLDSFDHYANFK